MASLTGKVLLLTGATGFIGSCLARRLQSMVGGRLILLARTNPDVPEQDKVLWVQGDLTQLTPETWSRHGIAHVDVVFHLAGHIPRQSHAEDAVERIYQDNLIGTQRLLESLPGTPGKIVFASTVDVYAPHARGELLRESSRVGTESLYGASKFFCEALIRAFAAKRGGQYAILRYGHVYGPGEDAFGKLIPQTIQKVLRNEAPSLYGDEGALRDYVFIDDVVEATIRSAMATDSTGPINIVGGQSSSVGHIIELICELGGFKGAIQRMSGHGTPRYLAFDNSVMRDTLGSWNLISLEQGLALEIEYFRCARNE